MTPEKRKKLVVYLESLKSRLSSPVPDKHKHAPDTFKRYLEREIRCVENALKVIV